MTRTASTGDTIVQSLISHGVDTVFGIPGVQTYPLFDAMARSGLRVIGARHEQTVAYMAFGYAQATGRTGVYSVVPGPGFLNSSAALISAYGASAPVVCITGEIQSAFIGRGFGHLHELPDQLATMRSLTKWAATVEHPSQASELTAQAFYHARSGRPRPTAIAVPRDVLAAPVPSGSLPVNAAPPVPLHPPELDRGAIAAAAGLLAGASNPMIMVGSGARDAVREVGELARRLQAPVVSFRGGRGIVDDDDPYGFTCAAGFRRWADTDVLLGIGSRLELAWLRWPRRPPGQQSLRTVLIDIDPVQAVRLEPEVAIVADAREAAAALAVELGQRAGGTAAGCGGHRFSGNPELAGYLLGGHPAGDEGEDLALPLRQPGGPGCAGRGCSAAVSTAWTAPAGSLPACASRHSSSAAAAADRTDSAPAVRASPGNSPPPPAARPQAGRSPTRLPGGDAIHADRSPCAPARRASGRSPGQASSTRSL